MLFSWNLLKRYINIKDTPESIANYLTLKSCEIEDIKVREIPKTVIIWFVTSCKKHPDADRLFITEVDCWEKWKYQIVTWADNITDNIYVAVALPNTYLPAKNLEIVPIKMRWVESNWMICSKEELWINEDIDKHWIWILNEDFDYLSKQYIWKSLVDEFPFLNNFIFDVDNKTLTNRPDLTGHLWQAIELNAIYKIFNPDKVYLDNIKQIFSTFFDINIFEALENSKKNEINILSETPKCRTYSIIKLSNIKVKKSIFKQRLDLIDLWEETINNFVDFSNIFMFLTSQPIHFFDAKKIEWNIKIIEAKGWEKFKALDWKEYNLEKWDIIIIDEKKILALAGIIWWESSAINDNTNEILVEIANFDPIQVRKTWNRLNLRTNAKIRFEKNINPLFSLYSVLLFLDQIKMSWLEYSFSWLNYFYSEIVKRLFSKQVSIDFKMLKDFSWIKIDDNEILNILDKLWFRTLYNNKKYSLFVPAWRSIEDINIEPDVYEEVIRIYWYENVKWKKLIHNMEYVNYTDWVEITNLSEKVFVDKFWFNLLETYPRFNKNLLDNLLKEDSDKLLKTLYSIKNPISPEFKYLRNNLYYNMFDVVKKNFRLFDNIKILEIWKIYDISFEKKEKLALWACIYNEKINSWKDYNIFVLKDAVKELLNEYKLKWLLQYKIIDSNDKSNYFLNILSHPYQKALIYLNNIEIGFIFTLHPYFHKLFKIPQNSQITFVQLDLENLINVKKSYKTKSIEKINYFTLEDQIVERDLSFVISKDLYYWEIINSVLKIKEVVDYEVFDIYDLWNFENWWQWLKSISIRIKIYWQNMTSSDINNIMKKVINEVEKHWWKLRK